MPYKRLSRIVWTFSIPQIVLIFWDVEFFNTHIRYYHDDRTHLALEKGTPAGRTAAKGSGAGSRVIAMPRLGGLHHRYDLAA
jgi:hypothetical protein